MVKYCRYLNIRIAIKPKSVHKIESGNYGTWCPCNSKHLVARRSLTNKTDDCIVRQCKFECCNHS